MYTSLLMFVQLPLLFSTYCHTILCQVMGFSSIKCFVCNFFLWFTFTHHSLFSFASACHPSCKECSGPSDAECITCHPHASLIAGSCKTSCSDGQYLNLVGYCVGKCYLPYVSLFSMKTINSLLFNFLHFAWCFQAELPDNVSEVRYFHQNSHF